MSAGDPAPRFGERVDADVDALGESRVEGRPAPGYGEYAPPGWVSPVAPVESNTDSAQDHEAGTVRTAAPTRQRPRAFDAPPPTGRPVPGRPPTAVRAGSFNRFATIVLLAYGVYFVVRAALETSRFVSSYVSQFRDYGYIEGTFQSTDALHAVAVVSAIGSVAAFLLVAVWALRRLRAGKRSWVILLVAGVLANLVTGVAVVSVLMNDPSFVGIPGA